MSRKWTASHLVARYKPRAKFCKTAIQMVIGFCIPVLLALKMLLFLWPQPIRWFPGLDLLTKAGVLEIAGSALAVSTAVDLAYMLYTPGPDEAVDPVITGLAATVLVIISREESWSYQEAVVVAGLLLGIGFMLWIRGKFVTNDDDEEDVGPSG